MGDLSVLGCADDTHASDDESEKERSRLLDHGTSFHSSRMRRGFWLAVCAILVGLAVALAAREAVSSEAHPETAVEPETLVYPKTLVATASAISTFAQDGGHVAWVTTDNTLHIRALESGRTVIVKSISGGSDQGDFVFPDIALAKGRALWKAENHWSNQQYGIFVRTASIDNPRVYTLPCCDRYVEETAAHLPVFPVAGSGRMLVYYSHRDMDGFSDRSVQRVVGARTQKAFDVESPSYLAVDSGRIAVVWAGTRTGELRSADGTLLASFKTQRRPRAIALSGSLIAVLTGRQIELFTVPLGASRGVVPVPWSTAPMLAASDPWVVFAVGRAVHGIDVRTQESRLLARASKRPFRLSVSARRVAWAENLSDGGRIRTFVLPG